MQLKFSLKKKKRLKLHAPHLPNPLLQYMCMERWGKLGQDLLDLVIEKQAEELEQWRKDQRSPQYWT